MLRLSAAMISGVLLIATAVTIAASQASAQKVSFEVTSIKTNNSGSSSSSTSVDDNSGYVRMTNVTARQVILQCYRLLSYQLIGSPDWINTARFNIEARADEETIGKMRRAPATARSEMMLQMIESLLEERFQLKVHRETRELPVFILTIGRDGPKLQETVEGRPGPSGLSAGSSRTNQIAAGAVMSGSGITMEGLASMLASAAGRPVIDKTSLMGRYDFALKFAATAPTTGPNNTATEPLGPSIFTAVQEQLGLRLESAKGPVEVLVIDSVQPPTEN